MTFAKERSSSTVTLWALLDLISLTFTWAALPFPSLLILNLVTGGYFPHSHEYICVVINMVW